MVKKAGFSGKTMLRIGSVLESVYRVFRNNEAKLVEINPLVMTGDDIFWAVDAVIDLDESSLFRHKDLKIRANDRLASSLERRGREIGVTYVDMDGDIGIVSSGAGLGMATMDIIGRKFKPANFLETGGGISEELLYQVMDLICSKPDLKAVFINLYGGINPIHEGAKGVVRYMKEHKLTLPVVVKALGNRQEETWQTLRDGGATVVTGISTEKAFQKLVEKLNEGEGV